MRRLLSAERHQKILERVAAESAVDIFSLAQELNVSTMTIRRDVRILEEQGYIKTTRGGASAHLINAQDMLANPRALDQSVAKSQIGQYAATLIEAGEVIFLGTGSTTAVFAQFLPSNLNVTVITPSLAHASVLHSRGIKVISTGGIIATHDFAQTGALALAAIQKFVASRAIIGSGGVSKDFGLTEFDQEIAEINQAMISQAEETMVLVDPSKAGVTANYRVAPLNVVEEFVTSTDGLTSLKNKLGSEARIIASN